MRTARVLAALLMGMAGSSAMAQIIINHSCTNLASIPSSAIELAKTNLRIAYGHTSHGSQVTDGMVGLETFAGAPNPSSLYAVDLSGTVTAGVLSVHDYYGSFPGGASDLGNPNFTQWATATQAYLQDPDNSAINVVMWSWCGQLSGASTANVDLYLSQMSDLEADFPNVKFVYMTGHSDIWSYSTITANNQRIRNYCQTNGKILFDFADIESYNPDGVHFPYVSDDCSYYDDGTSPSQLGNWAQEWQAAHVEGTDWYNCGSAHSEPLNANRKAYAAWWLWARLAGWGGPTIDPPTGDFPVTWPTVFGVVLLVGLRTVTRHSRSQGFNREAPQLHE